MSRSRPNILLLMSDQHNRDYMGCAGHPFLRTPHLDRLAASGVRFTNAYCANPICAPSRMTFLTSRSSSDIRFWNNGAHLASDTATFVHHLAAAGYRTVLCGRMHFDGPEKRYGYQQRLVGEQRWVAPGIPLTAVVPHTAEALKFSGWGRTPWHQYDETVADAAASFLTDPRRRRDEQPWFLTVGTALPHDPCICPRDLFDEYHPHCHVPALPEDYIDTVHPATRLWRQRAGVDGVSDSVLRAARAGYCGLVTLEDRLVGRVLEALETGGHADNTIVVYTSDHGDMAGHLRMWWKTTFYDGSCGVPLIMAWPRRFRNHAVEHAVCSLLDLGPTLVETAGGPPMARVRGQSLRRFLETAPSDPETPWPNTAFAEKVYRPGAREPARMIRRDRWKLNHYHGDERPELFDLENDPGEMHDLADDPRHADVRAALTAAVLEDWSGEAILHHFERWDADRTVRDRCREAAPIDARETIWSPTEESWFHRGYDAG